MESHILWRYAKALGTARSARMVGWAMNASHNRDDVPHRVVNRNGLLTGKFHFDGTNLMQQLLERRNSSSRKSNYRFRNILGTRNPVLVSQLMGYLINWRHLY
jgi:alkylated DNA nucleotide flippase Atl1